MSARRRSRYAYRPPPGRAGRRAGGIAAAVLGLAAMVLLAAAVWWGPGHVVTRTVVVGEPPDVVWQVLMDVDNLPAWRRGVTRIDRLPDQAGRPAWLEYHGAAAQAVGIAAAEPPRRLVTERLDAPSAPASWSWEIAGDSIGSRLTVTRRLIVRAPVPRALAGLLRGPEREVDRMLADLSRRLGQATRLRATALNR